jgi:hypothetical protein
LSFDKDEVDRHLSGRLNSVRYSILLQSISVTVYIEVPPLEKNSFESTVLFQKAKPFASAVHMSNEFQVGS